MIAAAGIGLCLVGFIVVMVGIVGSFRGMNTASTVRLQHFGWVLIFLGGALAVGSYAWRDSPWLALVVAGSLGLLALRRLISAAR